MRRPGRSLLIWLSLSVALPAAVLGPSHAPRAEAGAGPALQLGDRVEFDGVGLIIPAPGTGVWGAAHRADGEPVILGVETHLDGTVVIHRAAEAWSVVGGSPAGRARGACSDAAYTLHGGDWDKSYRWSFNRSSTPSEVDKDRAATAVRDAVKNITRADNDCGQADKVSATQDYLGTTNDGANIGTDSTCKGSNGKSVVGFGNLLAGDLALSCWWTRNGAIIEGDIRLNKSEYSWVVQIGDACVVKFSVEAVVTHEAGHVFGLGHVSEVNHGALTMSTVMMACQSSEKTLGLGDLRGLEALY
jgi:hypothetical protein